MVLLALTLKKGQRPILILRKHHGSVPKTMISAICELLFNMIIFTARNEVVAKVIFLHLFVILFTGGVLPQCMLGYHPPGTRPPEEQTPPGADTTPPGADTTPQDQTPLGTKPPRDQSPRDLRGKD